MYLRSDEVRGFVAIVSVAIKHTKDILVLYAREILVIPRAKALH